MGWGALEIAIPLANPILGIRTPTRAGEPQGGDPQSRETLVEFHPTRLILLPLTTGSYNVREQASLLLVLKNIENEKKSKQSTKIASSKNSFTVLSRANMSYVSFFMNHYDSITWALLKKEKMYRNLEQLTSSFKRPSFRLLCLTKTLL